MAARYNIKWRNQDIKKVQTYVRKFNAAITRLEKQSPELAGSGVLPERLNVSEVKSGITTRRDLNRWLKRVDRFFSPGARDIITSPTGFKTTKWQEQEKRYLQQSINAKRRAYAKKYNLSKQQQSFLDMKQVDLSSEERRIRNQYDRAETTEQQENTIQSWYNLLYQLERESADNYYDSRFAQIRNSYISALRGEIGGDEAEAIIDFLKQNDIWGQDILYAISLNDLLDFDFIYSLESRMEKGEVILERWKQVLPKLRQNGTNSRFRNQQQ